MDLVEKTSDFDRFYTGKLSAERVREGLARDGLATFRCDSAEAFLREAQALGIVRMHRDADERGLTRIRLTEGRDHARDIGLSRSELFFHTDSPAEPRPPETVLLWCLEANAVGGDALLAAGQAVADLLRANAPEAYAAATAERAACFITGPFQRICPILRLAEGRVTEVRLRFDPHIFLSQEMAAQLEPLRQALQAASISFPIRAGEGYAIANRLWLHGRRHYVGERELLRAMID